MNKRFIFATILALITLTSCGRDDDGKAAKKPPTAVETKTAATAEMLDSIEVTGTLEPKNAVDIKSQIPGLVKQVYVTEWVRVRKGQPLARIDVAEAEAQVKRAEAALESARAGEVQAQVAANRADREMARMRKLKDAGLATQQGMDDTGTEQQAARARVSAARAQTAVAREDLRQARVRASKGIITAPISGVIALKEINVGDLTGDVAASKPLFRIVDNSLFNLTVTVPSTDSSRIKTSQPLQFSVDSLPGRTFTGRVMYINPELSASDRSLKVIAEVSNNDGLLKGGLFAKGRIIAGQRGNVLQIPRNAVATIDPATKGAVLFVVENGIARRREIKVAAITGESLEVAAGLKIGEQYVVRGGFNLKDGDQVTATAVK